MAARVEMFGAREVAEEAADKWWLFLLTGIAWLIFALLVFQWDYTTVYAISYLFGVVAFLAVSAACGPEQEGGLGQRRRP